ncbi:MAG: HIG1 domain-containing protein [Gammaproteobacteria bacterium]
MLNIIIALALLATISALGLGLLSMGIGGSLDKDYSERFMWARIGLQAATVALILGALVITNI